MTEELKAKLDHSRDLIKRVMMHYAKPAVMCSFGKDSMVLLYLLRSLKLELPVIFHREPFFPEKYEFADGVIRKWGLTVYDYPPLALGLTKANNVLSVLSHYQIGPTGKYVALPMDFYEPAEGFSKGNYLCVLQDVLMKPTGTFNYPWDVVFHGHKSSDVDPLYGAVPLHVDIKQNIDAPAAAFPLRHWTDADIWEFSQAMKVPQQKTRYNVVKGGELADKRLNPDYFAGCTRCLDREGPASVFCPKLKANVDNLGQQAPYVKLDKMNYFGNQEEPNAI